MKAAGIEKAVKTAQTDVAFIADVSMEALVSGLMAPDAFDARFAMVGSSVMVSNEPDLEKMKRDDLVERAEIKHA